MASHTTSHTEAPLDLSKWRKVPGKLIIAGAILSLVGLVAISPSGEEKVSLVKQFGFSYLTAYIFCLSFAIGGLLLTILHHLFDASWSVPTRRITEALSSLSVPMAIAFAPILVLSLMESTTLYSWMTHAGEHSHAVHAKSPLMTKAGFVIVSLVALGSWVLFSNRLRYWSLKQDETGSFECTKGMRKWACGGVWVYAITVTLAIIMWVKALHVEFFSTMFGVQYFAGTTWVTIGTTYLIALILKRQGPLQGFAKDKTFYFLGTLLFAFTVFWAYVTFSQYFIIWNANVPEETFFYVWREQGSWFGLGVLLIFGHFFIPFLALLRIDLKLKVWWMAPIIAWAWLMHYLDVTFHIMPVLRPFGFMPQLLDVGLLLLMVGVLVNYFIKSLNAHPVIPQKDPRMAEALDMYVPPASSKLAGAKH
ncbi:MAG TPA: hypothetical protein VGH19_04550 [Verrucomicrobiae bacterium]